MNDIVTVKLNGKEMSGTRSEIAQLLLNPDDIYISDSTGPVSVKSMSKYHLKNAMRKVYKEWIELVFENVNLDDLPENLSKGPVGHSQFNVLYKELLRRKRSGTW